MNRDLTSVPFYHIDIPRTASRSIRETLGLKGNFWMHLSAQQKKERADHWDAAWVFTVVRNPYSRVVSQFKHRQVFHELELNAQSFAAWVEERYDKENRPRNPDTDYFERLWWPQWRWITDSDGGRMVDAIFSFENLDQAWGQIQERLGIDQDLRHDNAADDLTPYQEFYGCGAGPIIQQHFSDDFNNFAYPPDIPQ